MYSVILILYSITYLCEGGLLLFTKNAWSVYDRVLCFLVNGDKFIFNLYLEKKIIKCGITSDKPIKKILH